jgi:CHAT domain-containing protein
MKAKPTTLTLFLLLVLTTCLHSQTKPDFVFEEYRSIPSDTTWYKTYRLVNQQEYEKAQQEFEAIQHQLLQESNFNDYLFIATQYSYWIYTHRKVDKAKEILMAAVNTAQEHLGSNHIELLIAYYTLAKLERQLEDKISWYQTCLDNYTTDSYPRMGFIVNRDLGSRYYKLGKYQKAWEHWDACQTEFDLPPSTYSDLYAAIGTDIAGHDFEMGIEYLAKAIELMDTTKNDIGLEIILNDNIGRSYLQNSDYKNAIKHCKRANELLKNNRDLSDFKMLNRHNRYTTIIESYARLGEYENAHKYVAELRQELPGFANPKISEGLAVYNESIIYRLDNQYEKALQKLEEYYNIDIEIHISPLSPTLVNYYLDKADIYYKTQRYAEAIANYENTLKTIGYNHYNTIDDTLKLLPPNSFHNLYLPYIRDILLEMLESYRLMIEASPTDESIDNMLKVVSYTNRIIKYHYSGMANEELAMEASAKLKRNSFYGIFAAYKKAQTNSTYIDTAFVYSDSHRAFNLNFQRKIAHSYASDSAQLNLRQISDLTTRIANIQGSETANEDELFELKKALYRQKVNLSANFGLSLEFMDNANDALSIKPMLDKKAAVVQYFTMGDTLFIVGHNSKHSQIELVTQNELGTSIRSFIRDIRTGNKQSHWQGDFYNLLIKPMETIVSGKKDLHIFADERLMEIPFELLASPKEKLLVEEYNIEYVYSSKGFGKQGEISWNLLAIAPSFAEGNIIAPTSLSQALINDKDVFRTQNDRTSLVALQHSQTEVDEIAKIFESKKLNYLKITGTEATKQRFLEEAPNYSIVHIASHGVSNTGYNSGIFFYSSNEEGMSNYFLRMPELFNIQTNADLVVLSACKTGLGEILEGEGVLALPRGFLYAGAKNVVASLWKVHDQKTKELMILFYNYLVKGKSPAEALRLAKLDCITKGFLPLDWAGFILIGG